MLLLLIHQCCGLNSLSAEQWMKRASHGSELAAPLLDGL